MAEEHVLCCKSVIPQDLLLGNERTGVCSVPEVCSPLALEEDVLNSALMGQKLANSYHLMLRKHMHHLCSRKRTNSFIPHLGRDLVGSYFVCSYLVSTGYLPGKCLRECLPRETFL